MRRLAAEVRTGGLRVINVVDSSANVGAWAKGRSSSVRLDRHLRQVAPDMLLIDLQLAVPHVPSQRLQLMRRRAAAPFVGLRMRVSLRL